MRVLQLHYLPNYLPTYLPTYDELRGGSELVPGGGSVVSQ